MKNEESEDDFKRTLDLYLKGRLSTDQKAELEKQLDDFRKEDATPLEFNQQHADDLWKKISAKTEPTRNNHGKLWIWAAAAVIFTSVAVLLTLSWNPDRREISNKVILTDGTIVWLKPGATLDYSDFSADDRHVTLKGEGLFEVAKMRAIPFIIHCGSYDASVLGTSFNLNAGDSSVELTVLTGSVRLSSLKTDSSVLVNSREHVIFSESRGMISKAAFTQEEVRSVIADTQYDMHFEDTRMEDIVKRVEGKFDVYIDLQDADIGNCMISADFTDQSLPITLTMISEALGFRYEINGDEIVISGAGCKE